MAAVVWQCSATDVAGASVCRFNAVSSNSIVTTLSYGARGRGGGGGGVMSVYIIYNINVTKRGDTVVN